ncbi:VOC family protein [Glutamicibacter sp. BW78]|uniref:VOC family protein n=1 Tax=Glutamicibacter sp. BW78 TaxID=2024403 RepID=UPI0026B580FF
MRVHLASVLANDQARAERFYAEVPGLVKNNDIPMGTDRWLMVVSLEDSEGTELLLEPSGHAAAQPHKDSQFADGIPFTQFAAADVQAEYLADLGARLT